MNRLRRELIESGIDNPTALSLIQARKVALEVRAVALLGEDDPWQPPAAGSDIEGPRLSASLAADASFAEPTTADDGRASKGAAKVHDLANDASGTTPRPTRGLGPEIDAYSRRIGDVAERLIDAKRQIGVERKTLNQIAMVARMLADVAGVEPVSDLKQTHPSRFRDALARLPRAWGKSPKGQGKSVRQIIQVAQGLPLGKLGLAPTTVNRNLRILDQLLSQARSEGLPIDATVNLKLLRARKAGRARDEVAAVTLEDVRAIFRHPVWTGCKSRGRRNAPGRLVIRDGLYWVPLGAASRAKRQNAGHRGDLDDAALARLARAAVGLTPAEVMEVVRQARKLARRAGRP